MTGKTETKVIERKCLGIELLEVFRSQYSEIIAAMRVMTARTILVSDRPMMIRIISEQFLHIRQYLTIVGSDFFIMTV